MENNQEKNVQEQKDTLPSLASIFKPEEFFDMDPLEETSLSRLCCFNE